MHHNPKPHRLLESLIIFGMMLCLLFPCARPLAAAIASSSSPVASPPLTRVAQNLFAAEGAALNLVAGEPYRYSLSEIPSALFPADSPSRAIVFGDAVVFRFLGLRPAARYQLRATFLSDSALRAEKIEAGAQVLEPRLPLPRGQVIAKTWDVPPAAIARGELSVKISRLAGPNAVISSLEVWSSDPAPLQAPPALNNQLAALSQASVPMPRLSPIPGSLDGKRRAISLNGAWRFNPAPPADFQKMGVEKTGGWSSIQVPAEWVMQGFTVKANTAAAYMREFNVPAEWANQRLKLRFDCVQSACRVFVNGAEVGAHEGGFVPFELDITRAAHPGANTLALAVTSESTADVLASASQYAGHPLGGITRKVTLFAVPPVNIASQVITTTVNKTSASATLHIHLEVANESEREVSGATIALGLESFGDRRVTIGPLKAGQTLVCDEHWDLPAPKLWDPEHPKLYTMSTTFTLAGQPIETLSQRIGIRQVEVRGNEVYVNNRPIKLRGVCRHETHPLLGRSLPPELCRKDAEIFRAANVNYIRTSHYPPSEEFLDACDELGIFVECEAPLCWVQHNANKIWQSWNYLDPKFFPYLMRANLENVVANRNHPAVIIWSLANESHWSPPFAEVLRRVNQLDPSRPATFHDQNWGAASAAGSQAQIAVYHYPGLDGPARCASASRPVLFGEYCHVQTYNQREHFTDPGVRDAWGPRFAEMVDLMEKAPGCLGGAIWSGIDDAFHLPGGQVNGYGYWGVIDGWRREKPETFAVRKAYSPIRVTTRELAPGRIKINVENRYNFTNLNEVKIAVAVRSASGATPIGAEGLIRADIPPHRSGEIELPLGKAMPAVGLTLVVSFTDPRGFVCESVELPIVSAPAASPAPAPKPAPRPLLLQSRPDSFLIQGDAFSCEVDRKTGRILHGVFRNKTILVGGPVLMILPPEKNSGQSDDLTQFGPLNTVCSNWAARSVTASQDGDGAVTVKVEGEYAEAAGSYTLSFTGQGEVETQYRFVAKNAIRPRQVGMVYYVARDFDTLTWRRRAPWSGYPADHIGRPEGVARANPGGAAHIVHLAAAPVGAWSQDTTALGAADFRSSKANLLSGSLCDQNGIGLMVTSDGSQTARAFIDGDRIGWLIAGINAGGSDSFFVYHHAADHHPLQVGSVVQDTIRMEFEQKD